MSQTLPTLGSCLECGYDLRGLQSRACPECGKSFNPDDITTVGETGVRLGPIGRWAMARVGWLMWLVTIVVVLTILFYARYPRTVVFEVKFYRGLWPMLLTLWGARILAQLMTRTKLRDTRYRQRIRLLPTVMILGFMLVLAFLIGNDLLSKVCLKLSRTSIVRLEQEILKQRNLGSEPHWAGLYRINGGQENSGRFYLQSAELNAGFFSDGNGEGYWY